MEWIDALEKRFFRKHWRKAHPLSPGSNPRPWIYWSVFTGFLILLMVTGLPIFGYLSMPGIISTQLIQVLSGLGLGLEMLLVGMVILLEVIFARRFWCKYVCPVGATLSLFRTRRTMHLHHNSALCDCKGDAQPCHYICPLHLSPKRTDVYPYCFNCGLCTQVCEKTGNMALTFQLGSPSSVGNNPAMELPCEDCPVLTETNKNA